VHADGAVDTIEIERAAARQLYAEACNAASRAGLSLAQEPIRLTPQDKLVAIVRASQKLALEGEGGEAGESS
jgi:CRISPR-associated protein Csb1